MEDQRMKEVTQMTTGQIGLVCKTKVEIYYFLAIECKYLYLRVTTLRLKKND